MMMIAIAAVALAVTVDPASADGPAPAAPSAPGPAAPPDPDALRRAVDEGVKFLVSSQEGEPRAQWPYEGVYRVRGEIPVGYRIGGTGIVGECLVRMPG